MSNQSKKNAKTQNELTLDDLEQIGGGTASLEGAKSKTIVLKPVPGTPPFNPPPFEV